MSPQLKIYAFGPAADMTVGISASIALDSFESFHKIPYAVI